MFKLFDLNMNEIPFPEGVKPLDIFVGSIGKNRYTEEIEGRPGVIDYGFDYTGREINLSLWIISSDTIDYRLLRNELYALFDSGNIFYISETHLPSRVLKIAVDESYIPDRITRRHASVEITCRTLDSVFWESTYTTLELHDTGYSAIAEKYGLVDNIDDEKVQYRFEPEIITDTFTNSSHWERGSVNSTTGELVDSTSNIRTKNYINVTRGKEYTIKETQNTNRLRQWWIIEYDSNDEYIGFVATPWGGPIEQTFIARGTKIKIRSTAVSGETLNVNDIGNALIPALVYQKDAQTFTVYNAGNVTIEPESMLLNIQANVVRSAGDFTIRNKTTGEEIVLQRESNGSHFRINGMVMSLGSITNIFRDTNRRFISLTPGDNEIEVTNGTFEEIRFDFKYLYR